MIELQKPITAIQTAYKGYNFRSRLEARWAVFFDALGISWEYEPEGFELPDGTRYLPDFFLKDNWHRGPYVEIKPIEPTPAEVEKLRQVCEGLGAYGLLIVGAPGEELVITIHKEGHVDTPGRITTFDGLDISEAQRYAATAAARSARFEFGESGATL